MTQCHGTNPWYAGLFLHARDRLELLPLFLDLFPQLFLFLISIFLRPPEYKYAGHIPLLLHAKSLISPSLHLL